MSNLIEHILNEDYVSANELFESHMEQIAERKLFEAKRSLAAQMDEVMGRQSVDALRAKGYRKATDVLGLSPYDVGRQKKAEREKAATAPKKRKAIPKPEDLPAVDKSKETKRPGIITRNLNTLAGREPGYKPEPKKPEQEGGRVGKAVRRAVGGTLGLVSRFGSEVGWVE